MAANRWLEIVVYLSSSPSNIHDTGVDAGADVDARVSASAGAGAGAGADAWDVYKSKGKSLIPSDLLVDRKSGVPAKMHPEATASAPLTHAECHSRWINGPARHLSQRKQS
jgi:hypothetical protein